MAVIDDIPVPECVANGVADAVADWVAGVEPPTSVWPERVWLTTQTWYELNGAGTKKGLPKYIREDAFPAHIGQTFKAMQEQIHALKRRVAELELSELCGRVEL